MADWGENAENLKKPLGAGGQRQRGENHHHRMRKGNRRGKINRNPANPSERLALLKVPVCYH